MAAEPDFTPRYYRIEQALRGLVAHAQPNDPLPSEPELARQYGVSRMTARAAVAKLVADGLVYRESGRGTFVALPPAARRADMLVRLSDEIRRKGRKPSSRLVTVATRSASAQEAAQLRLGSAAEVVSIDRVRLADEQPIAIERAVFPAALRALLDADLSTGSLHEALIGLGRIPTRGTATLFAQSASHTDARLLDVPTGAALLVERRLILDDHGIPLELTESRYVGDRYHLDVAFDVDRAR